MTVKQSRLLCVLLSGAAIAASLSLTANVQAQDKELRIGFIAPLTGPFAQVGKDMVDGFNMYLDEAKSSSPAPRSSSSSRMTRPSLTPA